MTDRLDGLRDLAAREALDPLSPYSARNAAVRPVDATNPPPGYLRRGSGKQNVYEHVHGLPCPACGVGRGQKW